MKKYLSMLCCLGVLFTAGCGDDKTGEEEGPTGEAKLTAFSFKAENNPDYLVKDYTGTISGTAISVKVPADTDLSALVATFETADGESKVTVNGTPQVSGTTANDFSDPVDYLVSLGKKNALYTVTVSELPEAVWTKVTEWEQDASSIRLEIDQTDNLPCLVVTNENAVTFAKLNGNTFTSETVANRKGQYPGLGISSAGQPYIFFYESETLSGTVATKTGGAWTEICNSIERTANQAGPTITTIDGKVFVFTVNDNRSPSTRRRQIDVATYDGSSWTTSGDIPGRSIARGYWPVARTKNGTMYLFVLNPVSPNSFSIYTYKNGTWSTFIEEYAYPSSEPGAEPATYHSFSLYCPDMVIDDDGNIYLGICYDYSPQVLKIDANTKEINRIGSVIPSPGNTSGRTRRIALSPLGKLYMAYRNSNDAKLLQVVSLDEKTKDWTAPIQISSEPVFDEFECKFTKEGTAYLAYYVQEEKTDGVVTTPAKICLYKLATTE